MPSLREKVEGLRRPAQTDRQAQDFVSAYNLAVNDVLAIIANHGEHKPGESHRYKVRCSICGQPGTVVLSIEPQVAEGEIALRAFVAPVSTSGEE